MAASPKYTLTIDLNALNHLGINLYSNIPAVVSETVANSWDADAETVYIDIDKNNGTITVSDNGHGMSEKEINNRYLKVGFDKRNVEGTITPRLERHVMGRKGIGKLSLFSIANIIEVHSVKLPQKSKSGKRSILHTQKNGFIMDAGAIKREIEAGNNDYNPEPVDKKKIKIKKGTKIILRDLKKGVKTAEIFIRKRLARRFSVIGEEYKFSVFVNGKRISVKDRDYFAKIEYLWHIGDGSEKYIGYCKKLEQDMKIDGIVDKIKDYKITGWIGTFDEQKSIEEGNNTIIVQAWGKLIHEDILKELKEGGLFTKYLIGEIRADFLDIDDLDDIVTSDRQRLQETDPRFISLKKYVQNNILKLIQSKWTDWRKEGAKEKALENPAVKEWYDSLKTDNKKYAKQLFSKIESWPVRDSDVKRELYRQSILAFETLALKGSLSALDRIETDAEFELFTSTFDGIVELEAVHYYQISKGRVGVLEKLEEIVPASKERFIQEHIYEHLWLLDPSWERASTDERMEESVEKEFSKIDSKLTEEEKKGRIDIRYRTAAGKHIIIELKKYNASVVITDLIKQISKYRSAMEKCLKTKFQIEHPLIECICILGTPPKPHDDEKRNVDALKAYDARYITYDRLIQQTRESYRDYIDAQKKITKLQALINRI